MPKPGFGMPRELRPILATVPKTDEVLTAVISRLRLDEVRPDQIEANFQEVLEEMMREGLRVLDEAQVSVVRDLVALYREVDDSDPRKALLLLTKGFTSIGNQRKKRAGVHMEKCLRYLFSRCSIPCEVGTAISGHSDIIVPDEKTLKSWPERAVVVESKRTIRERWKEVRDEIARTGLKVWLVTLDDLISSDLAVQIASGNITLYVPKAIARALKAHEGRVRSLSDLIRDLRVFVSLHGSPPPV